MNLGEALIGIMKLAYVMPGVGPARHAVRAAKSVAERVTQRGGRGAAEWVSGAGRATTPVSSPGMQATLKRNLRAFPEGGKNVGGAVDVRAPVMVGGK